MGKLTEMSARLLPGPSETVAEFDTKAHATAARANLDVFLRWALETDPAKHVPPPVVLIITQTKLDPHDDRPRKSDWSAAPATRLENERSVVLDAPRSKHARDVVRRVLENEHAQKVYYRSKGGGRPVALAIAFVVVLALAAIAVLGVLGHLGWVLRSHR